MATWPGRLNPRQREIRVARMSCSAAQSALAPACPAAQRTAMFFTNDLRRMPVLVLEIPGDTTKTICLRRWRSLVFISIDPIAPGLIYILARYIPHAA